MGNGRVLTPMTALSRREYTVTPPPLNWVKHACTLPSAHGRNNANFNALTKNAALTWNAAWTWTCSMDMDMQHRFGAWTWTVDMHGCMDARMPIKSSVRHR